MPEGENTVAAELIEIPFEDWEAVDRLEGYPRLYDRLMFPAKLEDGTEVSGWVYVMHNLPEMAQIIESGTSKNTWNTGTTTAPTLGSMAEWSCHISKTQMMKFKRFHSSEVCFTVTAE